MGLHRDHIDSFDRNRDQVKQMQPLNLALINWLLGFAALVYCLVTPPFQAPDEPYHFFKAYQISAGHIVSVPGPGGLGYPLPSEIPELVHKDFPLPASHSVYRYEIGDVIRAWQRGGNYGEAVFVPFPNAAPYSPTMYAPQALGIFLGRLFGAPPIALFYLGRLMNALCGMLLVATAVSIMPFGKATMVAITAMPMTLFQMGSLSPDATIIGLGFLTTAFAIRMMMDPPLKSWELLCLPIALVALTLAKGIYLPVAAAGLLSMRPRFGRRFWLIVASMVFGCALFLFWTAYGGHGGNSQASIISRKTLQRVLTARPDEQFAVIVASPFHYLYVLVSSFADRLPVYIVGVIGRFGWNTILMPIPVYLLAGAVLILSTMVPCGPSVRPKVSQRIWWLAISLGLVVLVETALYLVGTPLAADYIQGTQGRYFTPFLPLLGLAFAAPIVYMRRGNFLLHTFQACIVLLTIAGIFKAIDAFWITGFK